MFSSTVIGFTERTRRHQAPVWGGRQKNSYWINQAEEARQKISSFVETGDGVGVNSGVCQQSLHLCFFWDKNVVDPDEATTPKPKHPLRLVIDWATQLE